jgi:hypothetical protein
MKTSFEIKARSINPFRHRWVVVGICTLSLALNGVLAQAQPTFEEHLRGSVVDKKTLDVFLDPKEPSWAKFDPVTGYRLGNYLPKDGMDQSSTIATSHPEGMRRMSAYADKPCRINTYGNSFTLCHQVSDCETWQEYLAGHLGEPIRNFGMGGFGVYQTYRRMIREEKTERAAEYLIFYIWGDDHVRSLLRCRHAAIYRWWNDDGGRAFHNNFWANIEMNLQSGQLEEHENLLPTPESLYKMTDPEWTVKALKDDLALNLFLYAQGSVQDLDVESARKLARILGVEESGFNESKPSREGVRRLLDAYSFAATKWILGKAKDFAEQNRKKLLVILLDPSRVMRPLIEGKERYDQPIVEFLEGNQFRYFDMNLVHVRDYKSFNIPFNDYSKRYFIGHYNPTGNHFFAYSLKNTVIDWLDPKPVTYQNQSDPWIKFDDYLPK